MEKIKEINEDSLETIMTLLIMLDSNKVVLDIKKDSESNKKSQRTELLSILLTWVFKFCKGGLDKFPQLHSCIQYSLTLRLPLTSCLKFPQIVLLLDKFIFFHLHIHSMLLIKTIVMEKLKSF